jgi:copper homeostasis protein
MEVCVDSLESAINAYLGGANRIELCSSLNEGGLTPTIGLYKSIRKYLGNLEAPRPDFEINCMIRCRSGDFLYSDKELETMCEEIKTFLDLEEIDEQLRIDGLVFGALDEEGRVDESVCDQFMSLFRSKNSIQTTFHRAFDVCTEWQESLRTIHRLKIGKILTSGQKKTAYDGRDFIRKMVGMNLNGLGIIAGSGVNKSNLEAILKETKCHEFHASCRASRESRMHFRRPDIPMGSNAEEEFTIKFTDVNKVLELINIYKAFKNNNS